MIKAGIELTGDWEGTRYKLNMLDSDIKRGLIKANREIAEEIYARVVGHIYNQDLGWTPLGEKYAVRKAARWGNKGILMASDKMVSSIKIYREGLRFSVGIKGGLEHPFSTLKVAALALIHEAGSDSKGIPARPVWLPTYYEMGKEEGILRMTIKELNRHLRSVGHKTVRAR